MQGTLTASLMLRKLASYPRQNGLALAMREIGRIERTLFLSTGCSIRHCASASPPD
jgi:TnpA family transposase